MSLLPYDIIYKIYFYINDYPTLSNFWILDREFLQFYMRTSSPYQHKFFILRAQFLDFILLLPLTDLFSPKQLDDNITFYQDIMTSNRSSDLENMCYRNDIRFIYNMYKPLLCSSFALAAYPLVHVYRNKVAFYYYY
jgi:hypothetical protein